MADGLNKVFLLGNLTADPELRMTAGGQAILKVRIACNESYFDKSNTRQERTEFVNVTVWGKRGEALAKILAKGANIFVEGGLRTSSYEKDGERRYRTEIVASNILLTGRRGTDHGLGGPPPDAGGEGFRGKYSQRGQTRQRADDPRDYGADPNGDYGGDDDIPF
jgi:single-strand DNA-binding protein